MVYIATIFFFFFFNSSVRKNERREVSEKLIKQEIIILCEINETQTLHYFSQIDPRFLCVHIKS